MFPRATTPVDGALSSRKAAIYVLYATPRVCSAVPLRYSYSTSISKVSRFGVFMLISICAKNKKQKQKPDTFVSRCLLSVCKGLRKALSQARTHTTIPQFDKYTSSKTQTVCASMPQLFYFFHSHHSTAVEVQRARHTSARMALWHCSKRTRHSTVFAKFCAAAAHAAHASLACLVHAFCVIIRDALQERSFAVKISSWRAYGCSTETARKPNLNAVLRRFDTNMRRKTKKVC